MSQIMHFGGVKLLAWKSGCVKFLTTIMSAYICCFYWLISMIISYVIQIQKETLLNKYLTLDLWVKTKKNLFRNLQKVTLQIWANTVSWEDRSSSQWPLPWAISFPSTFNSPQTGILSLCGANNTAPFFNLRIRKFPQLKKNSWCIFFQIMWNSTEFSVFHWSREEFI